MKRLAKASLFVFRALFVFALFGSLIGLLFRPTARPAREPLAVVDRVGASVKTDLLDDVQARKKLRAHSSAIAHSDISGIVFSGAASPGNVLTSYLAAAGYMSCRHVCSLTAKGRARHWIAQSLIGDLTQITVPLAELSIKEAAVADTKIEGLAVRRADVDFWYSVVPNALGRAMSAWAGPRHFCGIDYTARWKGARRGTARFTEFGGRWTVTSAASKRGDENPFGVACAMP